jgi:hypothetical protein
LGAQLEAFSQLKGGDNITEVEEETMKKIIAVVLLVVGVGLGALGAYGYFFSEAQERCDKAADKAAERMIAVARTGSVSEELRRESERLEVECENARQTRQRGMLMGLGGVASIIISVVLLFIARKRTA